MHIYKHLKHKNKLFALFIIFLLHYNNYKSDIEGEMLNKINKKHNESGSQQVKFEVTDVKDLENKLKDFSKNNKGVHTTSVVFGTVFVKTFQFLSQVGSSQVTDSPGGFKGFWKDGKFQKFTDEFVAKKNKVNRKKRFSVFSGG